MIEERGREWGNLSRQVLGVGRQQLRLSERKARGGTETETKTVTHSLGRLDDNTAATACDRDDVSGASANRRANHSCMHHFHPSRRVATARSRARHARWRWCFEIFFGWRWKLTDWRATWRLDAHMDQRQPVQRSLVAEGARNSKNKQIGEDNTPQDANSINSMNQDMHLVATSPSVLVDSR